MILYASLFDKGLNAPIQPFFYKQRDFGRNIEIVNHISVNNSNQTRFQQNIEYWMQPKIPKIKNHKTEYNQHQNLKRIHSKRKCFK